MKFRKSNGIIKTVYCLLLLVFVLVFVNIFLTVLMARNVNESTHINHKIKVNQDAYLSILHLPLDKYGQYYIHKNFTIAEKTPASKDVVLASHCTANHLHHVISLSEAWFGPLSIAVLVPGYSLENALSSLFIMYCCFPKVRERVSIHLVHPVNALPERENLVFHIHSAEATFSTCNNALSQIQRISSLNQKNYGNKIEYPNNLLRNIAKHAVKAQYSLVIDIDMKPNMDLYKGFIAFAEKNKLFDGGNNFYDDSSVFVLPAYEADINKDEDLPQQKSKLVKMTKNGKCRPFYYDICWKCQKPTDYERWKNLANHADEINVGYEVKWKDPWEPFFIAPTMCPDYDERFRQYGFNRISQACELHVAGYRFFVLDGAFILHKGFKTKGSFHQSKDQENEKNKILFRTFKTELKLKYPQSTKRCY